MAYSDLLVRVTTTVTDTCTEASVADNTGTYPTESGGFSPTGEGTSTRPAEDEVVFWYMWRYKDSDGVWQETIPESQSGDPEVTISLLQESGDRYEDAAWQVVELVMPSASDWNDFDGLTWDEIVGTVAIDGAVGQYSFFPDCTTSTCLNNANTINNNLLLSGGCQCGDYWKKFTLMQGATSNLNVADAYQTNPLDPEIDARYIKAEVCITELLRQCALNTCKCGC